METAQREFLENLLTTPSPSGFEARGQRVWVDYVSAFADEVRTDDYGNAVAVHEGSGEGPSVALIGHGDEIGFMVRRITDDGFLRITPVGGADRTVSKGQHVTVHAETPVQGVIGQTAIHLRDVGEEEYDDITEQYVDVGAADGDEARELVDVGDPVTVSTTVEELHGDHLAARGMDNRIGVWSAAEGLRRAVEADVDATVYGVATVQEELGLQGAKMVSFDLDPDVAVAVDVTHATDHPDLDDSRRGPVELGEGPVITRGSVNHPRLVELAREAAAAGDVDIQFQAAGTRTGTDADAFYTTRGGIPSLNVGLPNRYMHTPVELIDTGDLVAVADLLGEFARLAGDYEDFAVEV
ncbi:MAG: M42 family peptidase [Haloferacaceae archaeon]